MDSSVPPVPVTPACDAQLRAGWAQDGNVVDADARQHIDALDHVDGLERFGTYQCKYQKKVCWDIPDACFAAQGHKVMKQFQVGNSVWHISLQGIGSLKNAHFALEIEYGNIPELPSNWSREVSCRVALVNEQSEKFICKYMGFASAHEGMDFTSTPKGLDVSTICFAEKGGQLKQSGLYGRVGSSCVSRSSFLETSCLQEGGQDHACPILPSMECLLLPFSWGRACCSLALIHMQKKSQRSLRVAYGSQQHLMTCQPCLWHAPAVAFRALLQFHLRQSHELRCTLCIPQRC